MVVIMPIKEMRVAPIGTLFKRDTTPGRSQSVRGRGYLGRPLRSTTLLSLFIATGMGMDVVGVAVLESRGEVGRIGIVRTADTIGDGGGDDMVGRSAVLFGFGRLGGRGCKGRVEWQSRRG